LTFAVAARRDSETMPDGSGPQSLVAQSISTPPQQFGSWQVTVHFQAPPKIMAEERATVPEIFPNYSRNSAFINAKISQQIQVGIEQTNQFVHDVKVHMDNSDRLTAGMSDFLGGLNGSTQHSGRTRLALKTKAKSLSRARSSGTLPWLGFDRVQTNRSLLPGKQCQINTLDGVASTG